MRVAIAGAGDLAKYFVEEFLAASHSVVVISRSTTPKPFFTREGISYRATDYSVPSLVDVLSDCDAVVSTVQDYTMGNVETHLNLLEACRQSSRCKKFIPSEWAMNVDDFPTKPAFYYANHEPVRQALRAQSDVTWTLFNPGWLSDYIVPKEQRYLRDIDGYHPVDFNTGIMTIPGTGEEKIAFTAARDVGRAVARFLESHNWEETTYICGEETTWNATREILERNGVKLELRYLPQERIEELMRTGNEDEKLEAEFMDISLAGGALPEEKLRRHKQAFFKGMEWKNVEDVLVKAQNNPGVVV